MWKIRCGSYEAEERRKYENHGKQSKCRKVFCREEKAKNAGRIKRNKYKHGGREAKRKSIS